MDRRRIKTGRAHGANLRRYHHGHGRRGHQILPPDLAENFHRRRDHPRSRRGPHGQRSQNIRAQHVLPVARRQESVRRRRRAVRQQSRQESDPDHRRPRLAHFGISGGRNEEGKCLKKSNAAPFLPVSPPPRSPAPFPWLKRSMCTTPPPTMPRRPVASTRPRRSPSTNSIPCASFLKSSSRARPREEPPTSSIFSPPRITSCSPSTPAGSPGSTMKCSAAIAPPSSPPPPLSVPPCST